jgi:hypothetical protein
MYWAGAATPTQQILPALEGESMWKSTLNLKFAYSPVAELSRWSGTGETAHVRSDENA